MDNDNNETSCVICLDPLCTGHSGHQDPSSSYIAELSGCNHIFHHVCIESWSERSNLCPSCRTKFNLLIIYEYIGGPEVNRIPISDKIPVSEPSTEEANNTNDDDLLVSSSNLAMCSICECIDDITSMMICYGCCTAFHMSCMDMDEVISGGWFCPICQMTELCGDRILARAHSGRYFSRRTYAIRRARANRNTARTRNAYRLGTVLPTSYTPNRRNRSERSVSSPLSPSSSSPIMLSMSLLDESEERKRPSISPEETEAWNMFDIARKEEIEDGSQVGTTVSCSSASSSTPSSTSTSASTAIRKTSSSKRKSSSEKNTASSERKTASCSSISESSSLSASSALKSSSASSGLKSSFVGPSTIPTSFEPSSASASSSSSLPSSSSVHLSSCVPSLLPPSVSESSGAVSSAPSFSSVSCISPTEPGISSTERKLKRPSRSRNRIVNSTISRPSNETTANSSISTCASIPTYSPIQKLLGDIRSSPHNHMTPIRKRQSVSSSGETDQSHPLSPIDEKKLKETAGECGAGGCRIRSAS